MPSNWPFSTAPPCSQSGDILPHPLASLYRALSKHAPGPWANCLSEDAEYTLSQCQ